MILDDDEAFDGLPPRHFRGAGGGGAPEPFGKGAVLCEPTPASLAAALARVTEDAALAERLGAAAAAQAATMTWADAVKRLVIV